MLFEAGDGQVVVVDLEGSRRQLTTFGAGDYGLRPGWAPDARSVVYATTGCVDPACAGFTGQLVKVDVGTRAAKVLVSLPAVFTDHPSWSPDGRRIVFDTVTPGPYGQGTVGRVMVVGSDGTGLRTVTLGLAPSWAPDGRRLALTDWASGSLVVVDADTGMSTPVSPEGVYTGPIGVVKNYAVQPSPATWSKDGSWLAFSGVRSATHAVVDDDPPDWHAWVVRSDGSRARQLRDAGAVLYAPTWSPDGRRVAFQDFAGITVASIDGRTSRRIASTGYGPAGARRVVGLPAWSPRGSLIVFEQESSGSGSEPGYELRAVRPDGHGARVVAWLPGGAVPPLRWAPDSSV